MTESTKSDDYIHIEDMVMKTAAQCFGSEPLGYLSIRQKRNG